MEIIMILIITGWTAFIFAAGTLVDKLNEKASARKNNGGSTDGEINAGRR